MLARLGKTEGKEAGITKEHEETCRSGRYGCNPDEVMVPWVYKGLNLQDIQIKYVQFIIH